MKLLILVLILSGCIMEAPNTKEHKSDFRVMRYENEEVVCYRPSSGAGFFCFEKVGGQ